MATAAQILQYRNALGDLTTLAISELSSVLRALEGADPVMVRNTLIEAFPAVIGPYVNAAGELTATWYEDLRREAFATPYFAAAAGSLNAEKVDGLVRWGVRPLFGESDASPLSLIGGGVQRMVVGAARDTIDFNARRDVESVSWARVARPDACEFCKMLAGRGAVYRSEAAAGSVLGRGVDPSVTAGRRGGQGGGLRARGSRAIGSSDYHDFCNCTAVPTYYRLETRRINVRGFIRDQSVLVPIGETPPLELAA